MIRLPNDWNPRDRQLNAWRALENGKKRAVLAWHRRYGKDDLALHWTACQTVQKPGTYWHLLPQANQSRKAIWDAINPRTGRRRIDDAFPEAIREATREQDMLIKIKGGATWQVIGSDNYNALVGSPPIGVTFSEYALSDPNSWAFIRPILAENGGWALFVSTPRGRNHFHRLYEYALTDPEWFAEKLTVADTGAIPSDVIERERRELAAERGDDEADNIINQEYYCSFDAAIPGSYYGKALAKAEKDGRIGDVPYDTRYPVQTWWDLGIGDPTGIWFVQEIGQWLNVIDYYENSGAGADHYARVLLNEKDYTYEGHILPHDADQREWGNNGLSRVAMLKNLKVRPCKVMPQASIDDGINAVRSILPRCRFDAKKCERGLDALRQYQKTWDETKRCFSLKPLHDWTSHAADAFRTGAQSLKRQGREGGPTRQRFAET